MFDSLTPAARALVPVGEYNHFRTLENQVGRAERDIVKLSPKEDGLSRRELVIVRRNLKTAQAELRALYKKAAARGVPSADSNVSAIEAQVGALRKTLASAVPGSELAGALQGALETELAKLTAAQAEAVTLRAAA